MKIIGGTNIGLVRSANQDSYYIDGQCRWAAVADGMGGHSGGEVASSMCIEIVKTELEGGADLVSAIEKANTLIYKKSISDPSLSGMGTTIVLCRILGDDIELAHVGDSRAYLVNDEGMTQITHDHSIVQQLIDSGTITREQAKYHPQRNLITRAVGTERTVLTDTDRLTLKDGEKILICSDGLSSYVEESEIYDIIMNEDNTVERLIEAANKSGGRDNITVVIAER